MTQETSVVEAIRKRIVVQAPIERAFEVFTEGIGAWWPLETYSVGGDRAETAVFEGQVGGRILERAADGEESVWGTVSVWEPPRRVVYSWHPGRSAETSQEVEISFTSEGGRTRIDLEHRGWERLGARAADMQPGYDEGWDVVLGRYAGAADTA